MLEACEAALSAWACAFIFMGANARMCCGAAQGRIRLHVQPGTDQGPLAVDWAGVTYGTTEMRMRRRLPGSSARRERYFTPL